eukprot:3332521-Prymnesium_polylepis.1
MVPGWSSKAEGYLVVVERAGDEDDEAAELQQREFLAVARVGGDRTHGEGEAPASWRGGGREGREA